MNESHPVIIGWLFYSNAPSLHKKYFHFPLRSNHSTQTAPEYVLFELLNQIVDFLSRSLADQLRKERVRLQHEVLFYSVFHFHSVLHKKVGRRPSVR